jgi:hypothetical protein
MDLELLLELRNYISICSHTPGKLKLKFGLGVVRNPKVIRYVKVNGFGPPKGESMPGIIKTTFNPLSRSMTISYDKDVIRPELLHKLFICKNLDEFEDIAGQLASTVNFDLAAFCN